MAEDKTEPREINWRQMLPWTTLFQGFRVALDPGKLLLAVAGILAMALGWWLLAVLFYYFSQKPVISDYNSSNYSSKSDEEGTKLAWARFKEDRAKWNLLHEAAGPSDSTEKYDAGDLADSREQFNRLDTLEKEKDHVQLNQKSQEIESKMPAARVPPRNPRALIEIKQLVRDGILTDFDSKIWLLHADIRKPSGKLRTWPWYEDRGPNPFLLITGEAGIPWDSGHFWDWLLTKQLPVLFEPLVKLLRPVIYLFHPNAGYLDRFYFVLVLLATLAIWALFGGAITRMAAVQVARQEKVGLTEALRFTGRRYLSYLAAPVFPFIFVALLLVLMIIFGLFHMIPLFGDIVVDGLFWGLMLLLGLGMAVVLIGLVGWPLMSATISTEGTDSWEAVSRSYSYIFQSPWHYIWNSLVAFGYGVIVVFFVGLMGSLTVYLTKWGISQTPFITTADRDPSFLFVYAPPSFGWRELLLQGATDPEGRLVVEGGRINPKAYETYYDSCTGYNKVGALMVTVWIGLVFLLILGFGYSYFWSASTIIYLLMRRKVDDAELDEVYLEEEDGDSYAGPLAGAKSTAPVPVAGTSHPQTQPATTTSSLPVIEAPHVTPSQATTSPSSASSLAPGPGATPTPVSDGPSSPKEGSPD